MSYNPLPIPAPSLYAKAHGETCTGPWECHWCGAPCPDRLIHDEPRTIIGVRTPRLAVRPSHPYVCRGCWLFRNGSVTVPFLGGDWKDRQAPTRHSWLMTERGAWALQKTCAEKLYAVLLKPPLKFALSLTTSANNHLQLCPVNDRVTIDADTPLAFLLDTVVFQFSVYELDSAIRYGANGKAPGVQALVGMFGTVPLPPDPSLRPDKNGRGRPAKMPDAKDTVRRLVAASGVLVS